MEQYNSIWFDLNWFVLTWYMTWYNKIQYNVVWYGYCMILYDVICSWTPWHDMSSHGIKWWGILWFKKILSWIFRLSIRISMNWMFQIVGLCMSSIKYIECHRTMKLHPTSRDRSRFFTEVPSWVTLYIASKRIILVRSWQDSVSRHSFLWNDTWLHHDNKS